MTPSDVTAAVVAEVKRARTELTSDGPAPGRAWCRAWSGTIDQALRELHDARSRVGRLAVVPVGGYGRCELAPGSDIDLLLLHERVAPADLEDAVRALVYPLWDAGLKVGHSVRTIPEALALAEEDVDAATSMLDARVLAGDSDLLRTLRTELVRQIRR